LKRGKRSGDERMVGVKQETKVTSRRRGVDWGGGEKERRVGNFIGVPISMNSVLDGLRERRLEDIQSEMLVREKRTQIVGFGCRFEGFRRRRERYVELSVISIEVVTVSAK
jgi:hypothetical protein